VSESNWSEWSEQDRHRMMLLMNAVCEMHFSIADLAMLVLATASSIPEIASERCKEIIQRSNETARGINAEIKSYTDRVEARFGPGALDN
jgi:hypothetical protein